MHLIAVKIPKDSKTRLSRDSWVLAEAISRYVSGDSVRSGVEAAIHFYVAFLQQNDPNAIARIMEEIRKEGIDNS